MSTNLKQKLIEIFVDKLLIGLIVIGVGLFVNSSLERYKLIEAQRVADTTEFVRACQEIWSKVYEYETRIDEIESLRSSRWLHQKFGDNKIKNEDERIAEKIASSKILLLDLRKSTDAQKFILGDELVMHFWKYIGFIDMRADVKAKKWEIGGLGEEDSAKLIEDLNKQISSMRFSVDIAREYAISRIKN